VPNTESISLPIAIFPFNFNICSSNTRAVYDHKHSTSVDLECTWFPFNLLESAMQTFKNTRTQELGKQVLSIIVVLLMVRFALVICCA